DTEKPGSRKGRLNHSPEFRRRIAIARYEPGVSVAKLLAREHGLNANLAFTWRHRYRTEQRASETTLLPVTVVSDMRPEGHRSATNQTGDRETGRTYPLARLKSGSDERWSRSTALSTRYAFQIPGT
ncbi:MAG: transposase, partial [Burkholderia sp.]